MSDIHPIPAPAPEPLTGILQRTAVPVALFGGILCALLMLSWIFLLPRFTRVEVRGSLMSSRSLFAYEQSLTHEVSELETTRERLMLPFVGTAYETLRETRRATPSFAFIRGELDHITSTLPDSENAVRIVGFSYDVPSRTFTIVGDVRDVGPRSMTVLAQFVDAVSALSFVKDVVSPAFSREEDPVIGFHSPFSFSFVVQ